MVVFDINGLKIVNDTRGHDSGDEYIIDSYKEIEKVYKGVPIYRFGGDEFVIVLSDEYYAKRHELLDEFENNIAYNVDNNRAVVSSGMADFDIDNDNTYRAVFKKADQDMYLRKNYLKRNQKIRKTN